MPESPGTTCGGPESGLLGGGQHARVNGRVLARTEGFNVVEGIGERRIQFPAKPVIHGERRFDLPTVLGKNIDSGVAYVLPLRGALRVTVVQAE